MAVFGKEDFTSVTYYEGFGVPLRSSPIVGNYTTSLLSVPKIWRLIHMVLSLHRDSDSAQCQSTQSINITHYNEKVIYSIVCRTLHGKHL